MAKEKVATDEKFDKQDFDLFEALSALDKKDYGYYDRLTTEQKKKFVPFMMLHWMSAIKGSKDLQSYYLQSVDYHTNKYFLNETVSKHPKLQWLMLCASSPGLGKQFHQWIPHIKDRISKLKEPAKLKDTKEYFTKIYPKANKDELQEITTHFVESQNRKMHLAKLFPNLKLEDIEVLNTLITDADIENYERDLGN
jgi:hypothetical protein